MKYPGVILHGTIEPDLTFAEIDHDGDDDAAQAAAGDAASRAVGRGGPAPGGTGELPHAGRTAHPARRVRTRTAPRRTR